MGESPPPPSHSETLARLRAQKGEALTVQLLEILAILAVSAFALLLALYL
jgi:hypothetical protein